MTSDHVARLNPTRVEESSQLVRAPVEFVVRQDLLVVRRGNPIRRPRDLDFKQSVHARIGWGRNRRRAGKGADQFLFGVGKQFIFGQRTMRIFDNRLGQPQIMLSHAHRRLGAEQIRVVLECAEERIVRVEHFQRQVKLAFLLWADRKAARPCHPNPRVPRPCRTDGSPG